MDTTNYINKKEFREYDGMSQHWLGPGFESPSSLGPWVRIPIKSFWPWVRIPTQSIILVKSFGPDFDSPSSLWVLSSIPDWVHLSSKCSWTGYVLVSPWVRFPTQSIMLIKSFWSWVQIPTGSVFLLNAVGQGTCWLVLGFESPSSLLVLGSKPDRVQLIFE